MLCQHASLGWRLVFCTVQRILSKCASGATSSHSTQQHLFVVKRAFFPCPPRFTWPALLEVCSLTPRLQWSSMAPTLFFCADSFAHLLCFRAVPLGTRVVFAFGSDVYDVFLHISFSFLTRSDGLRYTKVVACTCRVRRPQTCKSVENLKRISSVRKTETSSQSVMMTQAVDNEVFFF